MSPKFTTLPDRPGVMITYGFGVKIRVQNNHLFISGGIGTDRHEYKLHRATCNLTRLVVLSASGYLSLDALQWLGDIGAGLLVIGSDETVLLATGPARSAPDLRRAQAMISPGARLEIARDLIAAKIEGQAVTLKEMSADQHPVRRWLVSLGKAESLEEIRSVEARAAVAYWRAWSSVPLRFTSEGAIPDHWHTFGPRMSHVTQTPRRASTPGNALLNYSYAVLEGETRLAALAIGLEPAWGFLHSDDSAATYDLMEPARPLIDRWLYGWLAEQRFNRSDFSEDERGAVRLSYTLRRLISSQALTFREAVAPTVEHVARRLDPATPAVYRPARTPKPITLARCAACGKSVKVGRAYCDACQPEHEREKLERLIQAGAAAERKHGGESGKARGRTNREHHRANAAVNCQQIQAEYDWPAILRSIENIPLRTLARESGLSLRYVSLIRRGLQTPHPRHWPVFAAIGKT